MRLALISTPRSGNTWLNAMLAGMYRLESLAVHNPADVPWDNLPRRLVLQLHWHRMEPLVSQLAQHAFHVVVLVRHPFDVLVSILNFCAKQPETRRWLEGEGGCEDVLIGQSPCSRAFLDYARGPRARALLSVSRQWWDTAGVCRVRYEQLVSTTPQELARIAEELGGEPATAAEDVIAATAMPRACEISPMHLVHMWQGQPGHWKKFITAWVARQIHEVHVDLFRGSDYACDPDETLQSPRAKVNWYRLQAETRTREYDMLSKRLHETNRRHADELERLRRQLSRYTALHPTSIALAERMRRIAARVPGAMRLLNRVAGPARDAA